MKADYENDDAFPPQRERLNLVIDALVRHEQTVYRITQILDFESIVGTEVESGRNIPLMIRDLQPLCTRENTELTPEEDLSQIADKHWALAQERYAAIEPFIKGTIIPREEVSQRAEKIGVNTATLYRWLKRYRLRGQITDLIPSTRGRKKGENQIDSQAEAVINEVIEEAYLSIQRPTATQAAIDVRIKCQDRGIEAPSAQTIYRRIANIPERTRLRKRGQKELAENRFRPAPGTFPNADYPLAVVQIDHTPADIILVDDIHRKPIGRPWITLAIDVYTRIITGYYLSFDAPSAASVGLCIAQSVIPKEEWLVLHGVDATWPVWGFPNKIHVDNGPDFRSMDVERACIAHGINLEFRPVKVPRYGGHIERLIGTFMQATHNLPGTTFSSVSNKADYDSEKHAALTFAEFEIWLVKEITKKYHTKRHGGIGMSPLRKWEIGIFGNAETQAIGMPSRPADRLTLLLDFLPQIERTIQPSGVTIDGRRYYDAALQPWIGSTDAETGNKRKFVFRRDPRDISSIWFFDPELKQYFRVRFADNQLPSISLWEHRQVRDRMIREGRDSSSDIAYLQGVREQRADIENAKAATKKARRASQRRKQHEKNITPAAPLESISGTATTTVQPPLDQLDDLIDGDIEDFGEFE